jgi:hypothetical protein
VTGEVGWRGAAQRRRLVQPAMTLLTRGGAGTRAHGGSGRGRRGVAQRQRPSTAMTDDRGAEGADDDGRWGLGVDRRRWKGRWAERRVVQWWRRLC